MYFTILTIIRFSINIFCEIAVGGAIAEIFGGLYFSLDSSVVVDDDDDFLDLVEVGANLANADASGLYCKLSSSSSSSDSSSSSSSSESSPSLSLSSFSFCSAFNSSCSILPYALTILSN